MSIVRNLTAWQDTVHSYYSGLGQLLNLTYELPAYKTNPPDTAHVMSINLQRFDALGNSTYAKDSTNLYAPFSQSAQVADRYFVYQRGTGRLVYQQSTRFDTLMYNEAGSLEYSGKPSWYNPTTGWLEDHANYYGADERLRAGEFRTVKVDGASEARPWSSVFEVYRYDALGRRVAVRTWRNCNQVGTLYPCNMGTLQRTVWAGKHPLYEIRQWASQGDYDIGPPRTMLENDTTPQWVMAITGWDASPQFGRVAYTHGLTIDQPLSAIRLAHVDTIKNWDIRINWPPLDVVPQWNWRGQPETGALSSGQQVSCQTTGQGQRCVGPVWRIRPFAFTQQPADTAHDAWWGSFMRDNEDGTRTLFRRNRVVDPVTGRFTQEDPIGLAGGTNLYGFAKGDPVNFSDPFGLCPRISYSLNQNTGKYDVTMSLNMTFKNGSPADATFVSKSIQQYWSGVHGIYNITVNLSDTSAPTFDVDFASDFRAHGEGRSYGSGRGGYMKFWAPGGSASGVGSNLVAHEFGHASSITYHEGGNSIMNDPPEHKVEPTTVGVIMDRCEAKRIDD